jgi:hypothetical protein
MQTSAKMDPRPRIHHDVCEKGFKRPVDVWFDNIKALLEMEIHPEGRWAAKLLERIYPQDAQWAIAHMQMMYLAICTPSSQEDEFLLTENAYAIHEGPVSLVTDTKTAKTREPYTEYHVFYGHITKAYNGASKLPPTSSRRREC